MGDFQTVCFTISSFEGGSQFHSLHIFPSTSSKIFKHFSGWLTHHPKVSRSHLLVVPGKGYGGIDSPLGGKGKGSNSQLTPQDKELFYWRSKVGYFEKISLCIYQKTECNLPTQILTSFLRMFFLHQNSHPSNTRLTWYTPGRLGLGHTPQTLCCLWSRGWSPYPTFWSTYEKMIHSFPSISGCHCEWWFKCWGSQFTSSKGAFVKIALEIVKSCGNLRGCRAATLWLSNSQGSAELLQPGLNVRVACISIGCAILTLRQCHDASQSNTAKQHDLQVLLLSSSCAI